MEILSVHQQAIKENGFAIINGIFDDEEVETICAAIAQVKASSTNFRNNGDLFAIRQFLKEAPELTQLLFTPRLHALVHSLFGGGYALVKSIYFDKPEHSNWFVSYHQDLTISVNKKVDVPSFGPWSVKQDQFAVQPPLQILEQNFTLRIHLDDTDATNGALRVIPASHLKGIYRPEHIDWEKETEVTCAVPRGGVMIMRPLLLHASSRTTSNRRRRVIHLEFSNQRLPAPLQWAELQQVLPRHDHQTNDNLNMHFVTKETTGSK